eukprot:1871540-Lingulodinium_polyedra.AAC.1
MRRQLVPPGMAAQEARPPRPWADLHRSRSSAAPQKKGHRGGAAAHPRGPPWVPGRTTTAQHRRRV